MKKGLLPIISKDRHILILGTMPGERSIALQQYYGNKGNQFWRIMFSIFDSPFSTVYEERLQLLQEHHIALWNVLAGCEREGSSDQAIRNEVPNDFEWLHRAYPEITHICFESRGAERFFQKHCRYRSDVNYTSLPSTSGLYAGLSLEQKIVQWKHIKSIAGLSEEKQ